LKDPKSTLPSSAVNAPGPDSAPGEADFIERFETLEAGRYWRAVNPAEDSDIPADQVLLLESIRWVDNDPHTIIVRSHPASGRTTRYRFRLSEFLDRFEFEPRGEEIRAEELKEAQNDIQVEQKRLMDAQVSPEALRTAMQKDGFLPDAPGTGMAVQRNLGAAARVQTLPALFSKINSEQSLATLVDSANQVRDEATAQTKWLTERVKAIQGKVERLSPFFAEKAAAAMAATEDVRTDVDMIMRGLQTLSLFVGKNVNVERIREGASAPSDIPLTLQQRRLFANEELAVFRTVSDTFDIDDEGLLFDALREEPGLVSQIFTSERAVVMMAVRRDRVDYGGKDLAAMLQEMQINAANLMTFFLVRDGENIYRIFSPETSHERANHLFPLTGEQDDIFKDKPFRGAESESITFDDVRYTDALEEHERYLAHYRRVLILLFGIQFREGLLGSFYPAEEAGRFLSLEFQERYFRFIRDADCDGSTLGDGRPTLRAWVSSNHAGIRHGSLVMGEWIRLMTEDSAPAAFKGYSGYSAVEPISAAKVDFSTKTPTVKLLVRGRTDGGREREFLCTVNLTSAISHSRSSLVCLDGVCEKELRYYIHSRRARRTELAHIMVFAEAARYLAETKPDWADRATTELAAMTQDEAIAEHLIRLRHHLGTDLAPTAGDMKDLAWLAGLVGNPGAAAELVEHLAPGELSRLEVDAASGTLLAYFEPTDEERDDRVQPFAWQWLVKLKRGAKQSASKGRWVLSTASTVGAIPILGEVSAEDRMKGATPAFATPQKKTDFLGEIQSLSSVISQYMAGEGDPEGLWNQWARFTDRTDRNNTSTRVRNVALAVPVGALHTASGPRALCLGLTPLDTLAYLVSALDGEGRERIKWVFSRRYEKKEASAKRFDEAVEGFDPANPPWRLCIADLDDREGPFWSGAEYMRFGDPVTAITPEIVSREFRWVRADGIWLSPQAPEILAVLAPNPEPSTSE